MADRTDVNADESFDMDEVSDEADVQTGHYRLDEPKDVRITESLGEPIHLEDVEYVLANRVHTPLTDEDKAFRAMNMDEDFEDFDAIDEAIDDEVTVAEIIHSDESGGSGIKLMQVETEDSLDEIIDRFADESDD
jgi:hypothetical protein